MINTYAVIPIADAPTTMPEAPVKWGFERAGVPYVGLEYGEKDRVPELPGWTMLMGAEAFAKWMGVDEEGATRVITPKSDK